MLPLLLLPPLLFSASFIDYFASLYATTFMLLPFIDASLIFCWLFFVMIRRRRPHAFSMPRFCRVMMLTLLCRFRR